MPNKRPSTARVTLDQVPVVLSEWRRLARSHLLSDRQLYAALLTTWNALCEVKEPARTTGFAQREERRRE